MSPSILQTTIIQKTCKCDVATAWRVEREMRRLMPVQLDTLELVVFVEVAKKAHKTLKKLDEPPGQDVVAFRSARPSRPSASWRTRDEKR